MVVGSNGPLDQLQAWGGLATSRLQGALSNGSGLMELIGGERIINSPQVRAIRDIGGIVADRVLERAVNGKELAALKDIGAVMLNKAMTAVAGLADQVTDAGGPTMQGQLRQLGELAAEAVQSSGVIDGLARLAEGAMGAIGSAGRR